MSAPTIDHAPLSLRVRDLVDGRPPSHTWTRTADHAGEPIGSITPVTAQPQLVSGWAPSSLPDLPPSRVSRDRLHTVAPAWDGPSTVPDPRTWSASLAQAVAETLQGRRPVGQLSRWVDERVLATLTVALRLRHGRRAPVHAAAPVTLRSVHLQYQGHRAVEVAAHVQTGPRSEAMAFRLDVRQDRWLCTALDLGRPLTSPAPGSDG